MRFLVGEYGGQRSFLLSSRKLRGREMSGKHQPARLSSGSESPACSLHSALYRPPLSASSR